MSVSVVMSLHLSFMLFSSFREADLNGNRKVVFEDHVVQSEEVQSEDGMMHSF